MLPQSLIMCQNKPALGSVAARSVSANTDTSAAWTRGEVRWVMDAWLGQARGSVLSLIIKQHDMVQVRIAIQSRLVNQLVKRAVSWPGRAPLRSKTR
jgi:hypothetical protein